MKNFHCTLPPPPKNRVFRDYQNCFLNCFGYDKCSQLEKVNLILAKQEPNN